MKSAMMLIVLATLAAQVRADVLVNQSSLNGNSFDITDYRLADDFQPTKAAYLQTVQFWYQAQFQTDLAAVTYAVYADNSGSLGAVLETGTVDDPSTGYDTVSGLFFADFGIGPLLVSPTDTYWLELHAGTSLTDTSGFTISWAATADNATNVALENLTLSTPDTPVGVSGFDQYSLVVTATPVPEPSTVSMVATIGLALAGAALLRRARTN